MEDTKSIQAAEEHFKRGEAYAKEKKMNDALNEYSEAIRLNPKFVAAYNNRGIIYLLKENYDLAIDDFDKALFYDPENTIASNNRRLAIDAKKNGSMPLGPITMEPVVRPESNM